MKSLFIIFFTACITEIFVPCSTRQNFIKLKRVGKLENLYEDLLQGYNPIVTPLRLKEKDVVAVEFASHLIHLIDVDEKGQIITTNLWLELEWYDYRLAWTPADYQNVTSINVPSKSIWKPDLVLYNNADGRPEVWQDIPVLVSHTGKVFWKPPMIYKSFCQLDLNYFPYDQQVCLLKFGSWTHDGQHVDLRFRDYNTTRALLTNTTTVDKNYLRNGMDMSYYHMSGEWDIINVTGIRHEKLYVGCCGQKVYVDITFRLHLRRMSLFFSANMMFPCILIFPIIILIFCLPPGSREKIQLSISILVILSFFYILLNDIMPPTSLSVPMIAKLLTFNLIVISGQSQRKAMKTLLTEGVVVKDNRKFLPGKHLTRKEFESEKIRQTIQNIHYISQHHRIQRYQRQVSEEWSYLAKVIDRIFFGIVSLLSGLGLFLIMKKAAENYNHSPSILLTKPKKPLGFAVIENDDIF